MEMIIQKAVELGVYEIIPVATKRAVVKLDAKKKVQSLRDGMVYLKVRQNSPEEV